MADITPIDATVGGASSNSYLTLARATTLAQLHLWGEEWENYGWLQTPALQHATIRLTDQIGWHGQKADSAQALAWPRRDVWNRDGDVFYPDDAIPYPIELATLYDARAMLAAQGRTIWAPDAPAAFQDPTTVDHLSSYRFEDLTMQFRRAPSRFHPEVRRLIQPLAFMVPSASQKRIAQ